MSTVIVILLLAAFSLCVTVGLLTVLQNLVTGDIGDEPVFPDHGIEQQP